MKINENADVYVPDGCDVETALGRTSHVAIGAHQDDLEIMAYHGIAECYEQEDKWFTGVVLTNGSGSPRTGTYADYSDEEMQKVRHDEQRKAADLGQYSCMIQLLYSSAEIKDSRNERSVDDLVSILSEARPEVLYLHNPVDKHDTHVSSMLRSLSAVRKLPPDVRPQKVYGCEVWRDLDWLSDERKQVLKVDKYPALAAEILEVFDSQISGGKRYDLAALGRRRANATYFESHSVDECDALTFAMDLTPLVMNDELSVHDCVYDELKKFKKDIEERIERFE